MALLPNLRAPSRLTPPTSLERVEAWTVSQLSSTLASTTLTPRVTSITLDIPLDTTTTTTQPTSPPPRPRSDPAHTVHKHRAPIRRDSQHRREALLKGKEGSRRRQRWENDRLLSNPHAQPPLPSDWEVQPTYTRRTVPYFLAPLWDTEFAARAAGERGRERGEVGREAAEVRELRARLKKARGAKGLLQDLEEGVRGFIEQWEDKERELESEGVIEADSEDEEIVFVGRNGVMSDERRREREMETVEKDKLIFQSLVDDHGAAFGRYLVHSIAAYYGLQTWSVTKGDPARREAYVGLKVDPKTRRPSWSRSEMPRPLWAVVC